MDFLGQKQILMFASEKYENIYILFKKEYELPYHKLFLICATLGARSAKISSFTEKGREFRSNYFTNDERNLIYSIILNNESQGKDIEAFNNDDFHVEARKLVESYAEGGMDILVENVFREKWDGNKLDEKHKNYMLDIISYALATLKEVPF